MKIRFHKILPDGRSVRYDRDEEDSDVLNLNIIVFNEEERERAEEA